MITIFSMPKAFTGKYRGIQERAIRSWLTLTEKRPEIILLGEDEGTSDMCRKYDLHHLPRVKKNSFGTPLVNDLFNKAEQRSHYHYRMYCNADIIFEKPIQNALDVLIRSFDAAVISGQRYESHSGQLRGPSWLDYFIFSKGAFGTIPPFALGKTFWDKWLLWQAEKRGMPVVDATGDISAVHQTHDYTYGGNSTGKVWTGREALENIRLAGGWSHGATLEYASWTLKDGKLSKRNKRPHYLSLGLKIVADKMPFLWPYLLKARRRMNKL